MQKVHLNFLSAMVMVLVSVGIVSAENKVSVLSLNRCFVLTRERSNELKIQSERRLQAEQRLKQAKGALLPDIRYKYSEFFRDTANGTYTGEGGDGRLVLGQSLFSGFRKTEAIVLSQSETRREEFQYQNIWRLLKTETTVAFYSVIQLETDIADLQNILKQMRERVEELKKRTQLGKSRESEILAVESQMATFQAQQEKSKGERAEAMETISRLIGVDSAVLALSDDTPAVKEPGNLDNYLETVKSRPDIETARQDVLIQSARVRITRGSLLPELDLDGSWHTNRSGSLSDGKWDTTLSLDIPLFQGGTVRNKLKEDVSRQQELENIVILRQCDAATEVQKLYQAVLSSYNQAQSYQEAYRKAGKSYQLQLRDYRFGLVNNLDVIQAMSMLSDTKRNMDRSLIQLKSDQAVLDIAADKE